MGIHDLKAVPPKERTTTAQQPDPLLKEAEAAKRVNVSISTFRRWRYEGIGPKFIRIGGILRYRQSDVDEFIQKHTIGEVK